MAKAARVFQGVYEDMEFPEYEFREYPKRVVKKDGSDMIVHSQAEELRAIDEIVPVKDMNKVESENDALRKHIAELEAQIAKEKEKAAKPAPVPAHEVKK